MRLAMRLTKALFNVAKAVAISAGVLLALAMVLLLWPSKFDVRSESYGNQLVAGLFLLVPTLAGAYAIYRLGIRAERKRLLGGLRLVAGELSANRQVLQRMKTECDPLGKEFGYGFEEPRAVVIRSMPADQIYRFFGPEVAVLLARYATSIDDLAAAYHVYRTRRLEQERSWATHRIRPEREDIEPLATYVSGAVARAQISEHELVENLARLRLVKAQVLSG